MYIKRRPVTRILLLVLFNAECSQSQSPNRTTTAASRTSINTTNATAPVVNSATTNASINGGHLTLTWFQTSSVASDLPSLAPSPGSFVIASRSPSLAPSQTPFSKTKTPSTAPSLSMIPSVSPFWLPSFSPTPTCHDNPAYRSPLNDLQCHDHAGTDCFRWRFLGLTADEVKELVESCPVTCNIQCGELVTMLHRLTFVLRNMENFLSPESTLQLQSTMIDYLNDFVQPKVFENWFIVIAAELTSQQILEERRHHHQLMRHLTTPTTTTSPHYGLELQVTMELHAFAVGLDYDIIDALLIDGIENLGLGLALRLTNDDAFRSTETSMTRSPTPEPPSEPRQAVMEPLPVDAEGFNQSLMWLLGLTLTILLGVTVYSAMLVARKRRRLEIGHKRQSSDLSAANHSLANQTSVGQMQRRNTTSALGQVLSFETIVRVMSSCSPSSNRSRAKRKVHEVDEYSASSGDDTRTGGSNSSGSGSARQNVDEHSAEHPLTGIIPPMIVYDGFDGEETFMTKSVVPSRKLHAPPTFLEALLRQEGGTLMDSSLYDGIITYDGSDSSEDMEIHEAECDSDSGSFNENCFPAQFPGLPPRPPSATVTRETRCRSPLRSLVGGKVHPDVSFLPLPRVIRASSTGSWESFRLDNVGAKHASPEKKTITGFATQSLASLSPRKKWKIPFSLNPVDTAPQLPLCPDEDGQQLVFHAPRKGKLGLVIQCIDLEGPVVTTVKTYSPLLGEILPGDRILDIDGTTTTGMTLKDVTGIMGGKIAAQSNRRVTVFRIVVFRPILTKKDEILGMLNESPEHSALLLSDSPCLEHVLPQDPI